MALKTDYTNDILDTTKNTERKYNIKSASGTILQEGVTFEDVTEYTSEGSRFGASDINATNTRVNQLTASDGLDFKFATDGEGNYGYLGADDSFIPFKSGGEIVFYKYSNTTQYDVIPLYLNAGTTISGVNVSYDSTKTVYFYSIYAHIDGNKTPTEQWQTLYTYGNQSARIKKVDSKTICIDNTNGQLFIYQLS